MVKNSDFEEIVLLFFNIVFGKIVYTILYLKGEKK